METQLFHRIGVLSFVALLGLTGCDQKTLTEEPLAPVSEQRAAEIYNSSEAQRIVRLKLDFIDMIGAAIDRGVPANKLREASTRAIANGDDSELRSLLGNQEEIDLYVSSMQDARNRLISKFPEVVKVNAEVEPEKCRLSTDKVDFFFDNLSAIEKNARAAFENQTLSKGMDVPVCGSYWNQVKLLACATGCGVSTAGLAAGMCGWACWCGFCDENSAVADVIC